MKQALTYNSLVQTIRAVHNELASKADRAVNISLTLRNWLIGFYVSEFELNGADRAKYGEKLLNKLSTALKNHSISGTGKRQLYNYIAFFRTYPQIVRIVAAQFKSTQLLNPTQQKVRTVAAQFNKQLPQKLAGANKMRSFSSKLTIPAEKLISSLSYSHIEQIVEIGDELKRSFYETEAIKGQWSVRELKRQIATLYYERSGLSKDKKALSKMAQTDAEKNSPQLTIRDPYIFEFLGIKSKEVMSESSLEEALLDKLQHFLLELGHGFCFEHRQKRMLIGRKYFFVDLVFYHRILKCHVLIDLKVDEFQHEYMGQLNTYVNWYKKNDMSPGDNLPIGILLCTQKDTALMEYALAGIDNQLFISKYETALPKKRAMQKFLKQQMKEISSDYNK